MCCIYENTNFESNSQLWHPWAAQEGGCVVSTKIQILKAIHNYEMDVFRLTSVVLYLRKYKFWKQFTTSCQKERTNNQLCCIYENTNFESNSQPVPYGLKQMPGCVVSTKIQILKAIHNLVNRKDPNTNVVLYLRKYKFWKQFTTFYTGV